MFIDSHCHLDRLDLTPFGGDFSNFVAEARAAGLERMLCVGICLESYPAMRALAAESMPIDLSVGVHPNECPAREPEISELVDLGTDPRVVAIGETGLDYYRPDCPPEAQQQRLKCHIHAARDLGKPLIVHSRHASADILRILSAEGASRVGGVFHCFADDWDTAQRVLDLGFVVSFSGIVTFKNAEALHEVARRVPSDGYLIETDSPYLAPVPMRGRPNYPLYVRHVAERLAVLRETELVEIAAQSSATYRRVFGHAAAANDQPA